MPLQYCSFVPVLKSAYRIIYIASILQAEYVTPLLHLMPVRQYCGCHLSEYSQFICLLRVI